jgi:carboxyl-terminal processing protease
VKLVRHTDQIPGVAGRPPPPITPVRADEEVELSLTRENVALSPLFYAALPGPAGERVGYLKLAAFSQNAGQAVRDAIRDLQGEGVDAYVLDLRSNPGGLVQSAADVARLFLAGHPTLFTVSGREGEQLQEVALEEGAPETTAPLAVLVNHGSASASEILSGALMDYHRAVVIGDEKTYGKGRIQSVFEMVGGGGGGFGLGWRLVSRPVIERQPANRPTAPKTRARPLSRPPQDDGSGLFVTVARYKTPAGSDIDLRGILPDMTCTPPIMGAARTSKAAARRLAPGPAAALPGVDEAALEADSCLLTAMDVLADKTGLMEATNGATVAAADGP